ncbi:MAG: succinyldiaminopimelate transaminase [Thiohalocapsa sp.]|jgi:N-succinyldiaminopimelate aminotransferase|uniref:succinyldiaminopimelate transaminase n=1 Tax=Thiohalocapsa sp. TaxID=2497641 RepID=UPI0025D64898|nr:succinyldiaminopimelate transaminase [Thiohalocapsa sp.]MCG6940655.1 succinyldiaminopimelate transaminase [Thiohalocapsa sp.]
MNPRLHRLQPYPFEKLGALLAGATPPPDLASIKLSIGEPQHATPDFIGATLTAHLHGLASYPATRGTPMLREAIVHWLTRRFALPEGALDPARHVLPVNGTREGLFAFAQAVVDASDDPLVLLPNPFYQIYEGAALLAGAQPHLLPCTAETGFLPDLDAVDDATWARCQLLYTCSPGNPSGAVMDQATLTRLIELADRHDFIIAADECYAEIYQDEATPPAGLLHAAAAMGRDDFRRCIVFHSLSKRSNAPGLRSGFVAGDAGVIARFLAYRTYHGCAMALPQQHASAAAWGDEAHVVENRRLYREKFDAVLEVLGDALDVQRPAAGFYLWPRTPIDDTDFARRLYAEQHVTVLPGSYLSRPTAAGDPGSGRVRMALVAPLAECVEAAGRIATLCRGL